MKPMIVAASSVLALAILSLGASAAGQPAPNGMPGGDDLRSLRRSARAACADDMARLCPNAATQDDRRTCMTQNRDKVSDSCKSARAAMRRTRGSMDAQAPAPGGPNP
jgi:hypothetical protein